MQPIDLQSLVEYVRQRKLVEERHLPFYLNWIRMFLTSELPSIATSPDGDKP